MLAGSAPHPPRPPPILCIGELNPESNPADSAEGTALRNHALETSGDTIRAAGRSATWWSRLYRCGNSRFVSLRIVPHSGKYAIHAIGGSAEISLGPQKTVNLRGA